VIATSWSDNPRKGLEVFRWLDEHLDPRVAEVTFVGRIQTELQNLRHLPPCPSDELAAELRRHDVFLAASEKDPCSNSLTEALTVGLPVAFRKSGGHPELVGEAGIGFDQPEELPGIFEALRAGWASYRQRIAVPSIQSVAQQYLEVLGLGEKTSRGSKES
jgi:glycosyltransferase involved in cell wall biosynthesis